MVPLVTPIAFWQQAAWTPAADPAEAGREVAGEGDETAPGVRELRVAEHRETCIEELLVALRRLPALGFRHPHPGAVADLFTDEEAPVRGIAHRDADEAVRGGHAPVLRHAVGRLLGLGQGAAQARVGRHRQDPILERPESGCEPVHGEDRLRRLDRPFRGRQPRAVRVLHGQGRRVLVEIHVLGKRIREAAHERDRVEQRSARGEHRAREVTRPQLLGEVGSFDPLEGLAEPRERFGEGVEVLRHPAIGHRRLVLALLAPVAVNPVGVDLLLEIRDRPPGEPHVAERALVLIRRAADGVREIDRESRVPARRPVRRGGRVDDRDPVGGPVLREPARGGEAGPASTDHDPVGAGLAGQMVPRGTRRQVGGPPVRPVVLGQETDPVRGHADTVSVILRSPPEAGFQRGNPIRSSQLAAATRSRSV